MSTENNNPWYFQYSFVNFAIASFAGVCSAHVSFGLIANFIMENTSYLEFSGEAWFWRFLCCGAIPLTLITGPVIALISNIAIKKHGPRLMGLDDNEIDRYRIYASILMAFFASIVLDLALLLLGAHEVAR